MGPFRFLARVIIGLLFVGHGTQKLFGWFGGGGPEGTAAFSTRSGCSRVSATRWSPARPKRGVGSCSPSAPQRRSPRRRSPADDLGDQDRPLGEGRLVEPGGYEYNLVLLTAAFSLTENGPGDWSVDGLLGKPRWGTAWALAAFAAAAAGSAAALAAAKQEPAAESREPVAAPA